MRTDRLRGLALQSVLEFVGVKFGKTLRGDRLLGFIVIEGALPAIDDLSVNSENYRALSSLPELDLSFNDHPVSCTQIIFSHPASINLVSSPAGEFRRKVSRDSGSRWPNTDHSRVYR